MRKTKNRYYENLNEKSVVDNKLFWKTAKPLLSDKVAGKDEIQLIENNELLKIDVETFFQHSAESSYLKIFKWLTFYK